MAVAAEALAPAAEELAPAAAGESGAAAGPSSAKPGGGPSRRRQAAVGSRSAGGRSSSRPRSSAGQLRRIGTAVLPTEVGGVELGGRSSILPRLIVAVFLGLIVLEVMSMVTGRYFQYSFSSPLKPSGQQYQPLYPGQQLADSSHNSPPALPQGASNPPPASLSVGGSGGYGFVP